MRLERPRTIPEVALMAGWTLDKAKRYLFTLDDQLHGMLLKNRNKGRGHPVTISLSALKKIAPDLFEDSRNLGAEVDEHDERIRTLESENMRLIKRVGQLSREVEGLRGKRAA